jgi:hypothetical protein
MSPQELFELETVLRVLREAKALLYRNPETALDALPARTLGPAIGRIAFAVELLEKLVIQ